MLYATATLLLAGSASGLMLQPAVRMPQPTTAAAARAAVAPIMMGDEPLISAETSRRAVLAGLLGLGIGAGANPAMAGYVTSLGIETTKPKDADIDEDILKSSPVQDGLKNLKGYKSAAQNLRSSFVKDNNMQLIPSIRKEFDFSKLRDDLNTVTTVFDDQTQQTTDRLGAPSCTTLRARERLALQEGRGADAHAQKVANGTSIREAGHGLRRVPLVLWLSACRSTPRHARLRCEAG